MIDNDVSKFLVEASGLRRGADRTITILKDAGVQILFGLPADSINSLFDAARRQSMPIITCRHEGSGSLMASAYGKLTRRPAAVTATNGPGVTHLATGVRDAWLDRSPLVVLPGTVSNDQTGMQSFQDVYTERFIANWCTQTMRSDTTSSIRRLGHLVARAREANAPVAMAIPPSTLEAPALTSFPSLPVAVATTWETLPEAADQARDLLLSHPVKVLVGDARDLPPELLEWAWSRGSCLPESIQCPGWGTASDHQWQLPEAASISSETTIMILGSASQLLIRDLTATHQVVHVSATPTLIGPIDGYLNVSGGAWLAETTDQITCVAAVPTSTQLDNHGLLDALVPDTAVLSVEPGLCAAVFPHLLSERDRRVTSSFAAHTRGYAVAGALAARVAFPGRPALAVTDLAGWRTSGMEWASAVKHNLQFAVLLLCRQGSLDLEQGCAELAAMGLTAHDPASATPLEAGEYLCAEIDAACWSAEPTCLRTHVATGTENRQWTNPEQGAMTAIGAAKATAVPARLEIDDESTLIACFNALYDASFDHTPCIVRVPCTADGAPFGLDLPGLAVASMPPTADDRTLTQLARGLGGVVVVSSGLAEARPQGLATASHTARPVPDQATMDVISGVVEDSQRLVILAGGGGDSSTVGRLAEHLGCPVVTTMAAAYAHSVPGFNGYVGSSGSRRANALLRQADTVIALGISHRGGAFDLFSPTSTVIDVNTDRSALSARQAHGHRIQSDICLFVGALIEGTTRSTVSRQATSLRPARNHTRPYLDKALRTSYVIDTASRILSPDAGYSYTGDVGLNTLWLFRFGHDHRTTLWSRNFATMGFSLPAALGASHATGRRHVAVIGDGGAAMAAPALYELSQTSGEVLCIVLDNQGLAAVRYEQEFNGWPEHESSFWNPDFVAIAHAAGWAASRIDTAEQLQEALRSYHTHGGRLLLHVHCSPDEAPVPATATRPLRLARFLVAWTKEGHAGLRSARTTALGVLCAALQKG